MAKLSHRKSRAILIAAPLAAAATAAAVGAGVLVTPAAQETGADTTNTVAADLGSVNRGSAPVSRSRPVNQGAGQLAERRRQIVERIEAKPGPMEWEVVSKAIKRADTKLWTTTDLNLWPDPWAEGEADRVALLEEEKRVLVTGREIEGREEVVLDGKSRWVTAGYLDDEKPVDPAELAAEGGESAESDDSDSEATSSTGGYCSNGSSVPSGVSPSVSAIHQAVCARWPSIGTYGTFRSGSGDHASGRAVDIMISGGTGWEVAEYLRANYNSFGISYIIYSQKIWSVDRGGEGWRYMEDRGSTTANHYDHVHVSVY